MANKNLSAIYTLCRTIGQTFGVLPKGFPTVRKVSISTVRLPKADWVGYGGKNEKNKPFIIVNLAHAKNLTDILSTMAHEMLHIKQVICDKSGANHGNEFRRDSAILARALGVTFYHLNGYDKPSVQTVRAQCKKKIAAIRKHHKEKAK